MYAEFIKHEGLKTGGEVTDAAALKQDTEVKKGNVMNTIMSFIGGTFSPVIPVLIAGGLTGAVLTLLTAYPQSRVLMQLSMRLTRRHFISCQFS